MRRASVLLTALFLLTLPSAGLAQGEDPKKSFDEMRTNFAKFKKSCADMKESVSGLVRKFEAVKNPNAEGIRIKNRFKRNYKGAVEACALIEPAVNALTELLDKVETKCLPYELGKKKWPNVYRKSACAQYQIEFKQHYEKLEKGLERMGEEVKVFRRLMKEMDAKRR